MRYLRIIFLSVLIALFSKSAAGETSSWAKLALQDLAAIKTELEQNHPGAVDPENPQFAKWMKQGYIEAIELAKTADSLEGYYFALLRYTSGFNDVHLDIFLPDDVQLENNFWPGFAVSLHNNQFIVSDRSDIELNNVVKARLPQPGDVLIACDGKSANQLFTNNILPFYAIDELAASRRAHSPRLMFDEGNPYIERPSRCTFENSSGRYNLNLNWISIYFEEKEEIVRNVVRGNPPEIDFEQIDAGVFWITLSSFGATESETRQLKSVIEAAKQHKDALRSSKIIVFDMRGNSGGSVAWGENLLKSIWGKGFVERLQSGVAEAADYRASPGNLAKYKQVRDPLANILGEDSNAIRQIDDTIAGLEQALKRGDIYYHVRNESIGDEKAIRPGEIAPKIYFLSDGACASACLDFADWVLSIPKAELIGVETNADTEYLQAREALLPSKKAYLWFSMMVYRGRIRGSNEPYKPTHQWHGQNWDTEDLQNWVLELSAE